MNVVIVSAFAPNARVPLHFWTKRDCDMMTIGVDLGGSHVLATAVNKDGEIVERAEHDIVDHHPEAVVQVVGDAIDAARAAAKEKIDAIGIGSPGNIDPSSGTVTYSPNFGWHNVPLGPELRKRYDVPVFVGNDARCATLGEYTYGTGRGSKDFVLLTLGTGIGGGIVTGGVLAIGKLAGAGEIGHHQIRATDGFYCNCGKRGCFEAQASGTGLIRHALAIAHSFPRSDLVRGKPEKLGSKSIRKAAEAGDMHGLTSWNNYADDLARGIANVIAFVNPEIIALGGGVAAAGDFMLDAIRPRIDVLTTMVPKATTSIVIASLGNDAGAIGAATMARRGGLRAS